MQYLFLDESGNHSLHAFEPGYPVFVLGEVIVKDDDLEALEKAVRAFKVTAFDDPQIVLHTADIVRNRHGFERMADPVERRRVFALLNDLVASLPVSIVACAVRKDALLRRYGKPAVDPYMLSLGVVVERFCFAASGDTVGGAIVAEQRGGRLDRERSTSSRGPDGAARRCGPHLVSTRDLQTSTSSRHIRHPAPTHKEH